MTPKEFLTAFFGKTYNMPAEDVASLLNEDGTEINATALDTVLSKDVTRVKSFTDKNQEFFNNGQAKATKELMTDFEKKVQEKFALTSDKKGLELIDEIVGLKTGDKTSIEESKVKAHPAYIALQDAHTKKINEVETGWKDKYGTFEKQVAKKETLSKVIEKSMPILLKGYGLPEDEALRANQLKFFTQEVEALDWEPHEADYIIKDSKGEVVNDKHGNRMTHDKLVHQVAANYWPKKDGEERSGSGGENNPAGKGNPGSTFKGKVPANETEYRQALAGCKTGEERIALDDAYKASTAGSK